MAKIWRSRDIIGAEDAQRWENKADASHRHKVADIDGLEAIIGNQTTNKANQADLTAHTQNQTNPHNVTKQQVGLGNVMNVEQASKQDFQNHLNNHNNPHSVTKAQVGLGNVTNVEQASKTDFDAHARDTTKHITQQERTSWNGKADGRALTDHTGNHNNPHGVTKTQVGLGNVVNVEQASKSEFNSHSQNSTIHVSSVDKNRWNNAQLTKLTNDNGSAKAATGNWDNYVESGMYAGAGLTNSPKNSRLPLYMTVTKMDGQNVMQQAVDSMNTFTAVRTKVNGVWGPWQVIPRLDVKVFPLQFVDGIRPSKQAGDDDNKLIVIGNLVLLRAFIDKDSINQSNNTIDGGKKKLFYLPQEYYFKTRVVDTVGINNQRFTSSYQSGNLSLGILHRPEGVVSTYDNSQESKDIAFVDSWPKL